MNVDTKAVADLVCRVLSGMTETAQEKTVPVGVSNRHIHLTREHLDILFGKGYELTPLKDLSQPGQYACKELLTIVGRSKTCVCSARCVSSRRWRYPAPIPLS